MELFGQTLLSSFAVKSLTLLWHENGKSHPIGFEYAGLVMLIN